jgi:hypothetical protein
MASGIWYSNQINIKINCQKKKYEENKQEEDES